MPRRAGQAVSLDGYEYHGYGEATSKVEDWIRKYPEEVSFDYRQIGDECGIQYPTVSAIVLKMVRSKPPTLARGDSAGEYTRITGVKPAVPRGRGPSRAVPQLKAEPAGTAGQGPRPGDLLEVIGQLRDGAVMLRGDDGTLWKAEELEI